MKKPQVDIFLLDWNAPRPFGDEKLGTDSVEAFDAGRYEYTASLNIDAGQTPYAAKPPVPDLYLAEQAYLAQGNNLHGNKLRRDRQSMSVGDAVLVNEARAYVVARSGFERVPKLDHRLEHRIAESWERWTDDSETLEKLDAVG